jgi:hypothetical protein
VGTVTGGMIPEPIGDDGVVPAPKLRAVLAEPALRAMAGAGGGAYYEIGREPDRELAFRVVSSVRQRAPLQDETTSYEDLYWHAMVGAAALLGIAALLLRRPAELWWQAAGAAVALGILVAVAA